jgi:hypothetical protein
MVAGCTADALDVLASAGAFPSGPNIKALLELFNLEHIYSADAIRRAINRILEKATPIVEIAGIEVLNCSSCVITPEIGPYYEKDFRDSVSRLLASLLIIPYIHKEWEDYLYVVPGVSWRYIVQDSMTFCCEVDNVISAMDDLLIGGPFYAAGTLPLVRSYFGFLERLSPELIWARANEASSIHLAITLEALRILRASDSNATLKSVPRFRVGSDFWDSLVRTASGPNGTFAGAVREACARIILALPKNRGAPFLAPSGSRRGKWRQVERLDGALGFRSHITKGHEALRLMYWEIKSSASHNTPQVVEFANVGAKAELLISFGQPGGAIDTSW